MGEARPDRSAERRRLVLNPVSGGADHAETVRRLAAIHQFPVVETERGGHGVELAKAAAADSVDLLAVCGGDGTLHEVVEGLAAVDALDAVTVCVIPAGTENIVAGDLGIETLGEGFELADSGETRRLDLGVANDEPFVMSAIAGVPADVSEAATADLKERFGSVAFLIGGLREGLSFDGLEVTIDASGGSAETAWTGEALAVLVGNLRRLGKNGGRADAEDGLLAVEIIERMPPGEAVREAIEQRFLDRDTPHVRALRTTRLAVDPLGAEPIRFSLDGELREFETVEFGVLPDALRLRVGPEYRPEG
ncbi:MAG: diacylglycerol kinase family protein [Euryarchaeota archaeon]|nr:diacylglycerol kinase family protein [Euryarchaeota archaeon]